MSLTIWIPACASSSMAFHMMYSAYKLNEKSGNIQPWCTPFPILNQSTVSLSGLGIRVMVASQNEFGSVPPPAIWDQKARSFYYIKQSLDLGCLRIVMLSKAAEMTCKGAESKSGNKSFFEDKLCVVSLCSLWHDSWTKSTFQYLLHLNMTWG